MNAEERCVKPPVTSLRADFLACVVLAVIAIGLYLPMLDADFVYDARATVLENHAISTCQ